MAAAFAAALALALLVLAAMGAGEHGTVAALRATGRLSFLLFWPAYAGGALAKLFGPRLAPLARRTRSFGLSFAAAHLVHLGLVVWLYRIAARPPLSPDMFALFTVAAACTYLLALLSAPKLGNLAAGPAGRIVRTVGLECIAFAFLVDFVITPLRFGVRRPLEYLPFAILAILGALLRLTAAVRGPEPRRQPAQQ
ncbi:MAG TPA: hypothetical protein VN668_05785 [Stellaceae bacterium]|nr:hypothetical protein [Stellaceae bacterium]